MRERGIKIKWKDGMKITVDVHEGWKWEKKRRE